LLFAGALACTKVLELLLEFALAHDPTDQKS